MNILLLLFFKFYSLIFCLRYLSFRKAIHIPILIHPSVKTENLNRDAIVFAGKTKTSMLVLGFKGTTGRSNCRSLLSIERGGRLIVGDGVNMARGTRIVIGAKGRMTIGKHFCCNGDCFFNCTTRITVGDDNMYGWNINFNTNDGHHVYENGKQKSMEGDIVIGNHVWIASCSHIAKNTIIADDCVIAQNSLVNKRFEKPQCLIGGMPAKLLKENFTWSAE